MRIIAALLVLLLLSAGCMGRQAHPRREGGGEQTKEQGEGKKEEGKQKEESPRTIAGAFLHALRDEQAEGAWEHLSDQSRKELGPEARDFAEKQFAGLRELLGEWKEYRVLEPKDEESLAVVVVTKERGAAAFPLRRQEDEWKVEAGIGPHVTPLLPEPDSTDSGRSVRLAHRAGGGKETVKQVWTWLDGKLVTLHGAGAYDTDITSTAELRDSLDEGEHTVVVLARDGKGNLGAHGWSFRATAP
jgi:hypothetical protein